MDNPESIISGHSHSFDTGIASTLGLHAAIVFNHIVYWLKINASKKDAKMINGRYWMYETQQQISDFLGYLSKDEVHKAVKKLKEAGLLISENLNPNPFDKTSWYTVSDQNLIIKKMFTKTSIDVIHKANRRHVYTEHKEQPIEEQTYAEDTPPVVVRSSKEEEKVKSQEASDFLTKASESLGYDLKISAPEILRLIKKFGFIPVFEHINYMIDQQKKSQRATHSTKRNKPQPIGKPYIYLRIACEKNYAEVYLE